MQLFPNPIPRIENQFILNDSQTHESLSPRNDNTSDNCDLSFNQFGNFGFKIDFEISEDETIEIGMKLLQEQEYKKAEKFLFNATLAHPLSSKVHLLYGIVAKAQKKSQEAIASFRKVLYLDEKNILARFILQQCGRHMVYTIEQKLSIVFYSN